MPNDPAARALRQEAILELISGETPIHSQGELVQLLAEKGISANQSSISRDLRDLKIIRVRGAYAPSTWDPLEVSPDFYRWLGTFVRRASAAGPNLTVVKTRPGSGPLLGHYLEEEDWPEIEGILTGQSTLFVATADGGQERVLRWLDSISRTPSGRLRRG